VAGTVTARCRWCCPCSGAAQLLRALATAEAARLTERTAADQSATGLIPVGCAPPPSRQTRARPTCQGHTMLLHLHASECPAPHNTVLSTIGMPRAAARTASDAMEPNPNDGLGCANHDVSSLCHELTQPLLTVGRPEIGYQCTGRPGRIRPVGNTALTPRVPPGRVQRLAVALDPGVPQQRPRIRTTMRVLLAGSCAAQDCI